MLAPERAGASLTPSPVIATISPCSCNEDTIRIFCRGVTREKMAFSTDSLNSSSDMERRSAPLTGSASAPSMANSWPIADAVI